MKRRTVAAAAVALVALAAFLGWRFLRPMNIFVVSAAFERPVDTGGFARSAGALRAAACGECHARQFADWQTTMHAAAWTDPYYQRDWVFEGSRQVCNNCHTPLDRQQDARVLGFRDRDKWQPVLASNPDFDRALQQEGVTCLGCHLRDGVIQGPRGSAVAPHPVARFADPNELCLRCHVVQGERWDTFYRLPPCGTVAEIAGGGAQDAARSGEYRVRDAGALGCVQCHMPAAADGARRHAWRGGHDRETVRAALDAQLSIEGESATLVLRNAGAGHFLPTGTPDRHLTVRLRALDASGGVLRESHHTLARAIMWRPFIVDLRDTRLRADAPQRFTLDLPRATHAVEAEVRYHLLGEPRRRRIGYQPADPISYVVAAETRAVR
ncbi:MAG: multiheme c-type cytochrome [Burkholderiales bacterium]|mgnify:CR=1 FL=1